MGISTDIEWADSTLNIQMGCDGCELWNPAAGIRHCYAGTLTERYAGRKGWPKTFSEPVLFPNRLREAIETWPDLTGVDRPTKPWLNSKPRIVFPNDMGDTWTESLPVDWLHPHIAEMERVPWIWMFLTKRPHRMAKCFESYGRVPKNFWLGTSVTSNANLNRIDLLQRIPDAFLWLSLEPQIESVDISKYLQGTRRLGFLIFGGESGPGARPFDIRWAALNISRCRQASVPVFCKQLGSNVVQLRCAHPKGGDMSAWPAWAKVREFPV